MLVAATPMMTSACGFAFSARTFAVMTPVESRTHFNSIFGSILLKLSAYAFNWSVSSAVYTSSWVFCAKVRALASANTSVTSARNEWREKVFMKLSLVGWLTGDKHTNRAYRIVPAAARLMLSIYRC